MTTPWMLDELAHAGPEHLDPDFVAGYERKQGYPDPPRTSPCSPPRAGSGRSRPWTSPRRCWSSCAGEPPRPLIYDFQPSEAEAVFGRWLEGAADDPALGYTSADFAEHVRTEHSTFRWLLEPMLAAAGFQILTVEFSGSVYGAYTCQKR